MTDTSDSTAAAASEALEAVPTTTASKVCLCFRPEGVGPFIELWDTFMMPRNVVDNPEALDPSIQQIIPYVTFFRAKDCGQREDGSAIEGLELLSYRRGSQSGEGRLTAKRALGFGGHIDSLPGANILELIHSEATREVQEELGLTMNPRALYAALINTVRNHSYLSFNDGTVNAVHTGIAILTPLKDHTEEETFTLEHGHIEDLQWIDPSTFTDEELAKNDYELWSQAIIRGMRGKLLEFEQAHAQQAAMRKQMQQSAQEFIDLAARAQQQAAEDAQAPANDAVVGAEEPAEQAVGVGDPAP